MSAEELSRIIFECLERSGAVEVDGLGVFHKESSGRISLCEANRTRVFIAYAVEDAALAERLFVELQSRGFAPWMDRRNLLPGQNWPRRIQEAIENADLFIACFSSVSARKRGGFQAEIRYALACASRVPLDDIYLIPVRLDACRVPTRIMKETQYIDLFPCWDEGFEKLVTALRSSPRRTETN